MARHPISENTSYLDYIMKHRISEGVDEFLVKWINEPISAATWIPYDDILDKAP